MARTIITPTAQPDAYDDALAALTWVAADPANGNRILLGRDRSLGLMVRNVGDDVQHVTVYSVADAQQRTNHLAGAVLEAGAYYLLPEFEAEGWLQTDGYLYITASDADVEFAVWRRP